ncbi:hypothetical protein CLNEO_18490 [Anaerotignum neopropionicum]|uniref:Copper amine oxidase-like N-terminal domain-containing protein n=1 Tax=Anaerotignum neopropionicum TaxID=36847 RepID=A0A136WE79_9FIRM|nr:copper amine oxidase N-terminal domain-containing protein [Anaerotignum neopropionicum]KXL52826.1 hypothetical protein CLNEO_18490 [Anaerotignum neopropionicum]
MKRLKLCVLTIIAILLLQSQVVFAADQEINIVVNGNPIEFTENSGYPYVDENSRTMVPLRITMESAGCSVGYDKTNQVAIVISEHDRVEVPIGTDYIYNNNEKLQNDTFAVVNNGRTYLPIRIVLESMGYTVEWDSKTKTVNAYNFTISDEFVPYSTSSLETLVKNVLSGDVVYIGGQYYATPEYVKQITNTVIQYTGDDLNTSIYPQSNRFDFTDFDSNSVEWK